MKDSPPKNLNKKRAIAIREVNNIICAVDLFNAMDDSVYCACAAKDGKKCQCMGPATVFREFDNMSPQLFTPTLTLFTAPWTGSI